METDGKTKVEYGLFEDERGVPHIGERRDGELVRAVPAVEDGRLSNGKRIRGWLDNASEIDDLVPEARVNPYAMAKEDGVRAGMKTWRTLSTEWVSEVDLLMWEDSKPEIMQRQTGVARARPLAGEPDRLYRSGFEAQAG